MKRSLAILSVTLLLGACTTGQLTSLQTASTNFQNAVAAINADIAAVSPAIARGCGDLQTAATLLQPLVPTKAKAPQYFAAANAALNAYCQAVPSQTSIQATASAIAKAVVAAQAGYNAAVGR